MMNDLEKIRHLIEHWIEHNKAHVETYHGWASRTAALGQNELSDVLTQIVHESEKLEILFHKALQSIED